MPLIDVSAKSGLILLFVACQPVLQYFVLATQQHTRPPVVNSKGISESRVTLTRFSVPLLPNTRFRSGSKTVRNHRARPNSFPKIDVSSIFLGSGG